MGADNVNEVTFTLTKATSVHFLFYVSLGNTAIIKNIQIEKGSTATEYEEYIKPTMYELNSSGQYEEIKKQKITTGVEFETGKIKFGKIEYGKILEVGELPNSTGKAIAHNIEEDFTITGLENHFNSKSNGIQISFTEIGNDIVHGYNRFINCYVSKYSITYQTTVDFSSYSGFIELHYIKD